LSRIIPEATQVGGAPTAVETAVSLVTQLQHSLLKQQDQAAAPKFPIASQSAQDAIQIQNPAGTARSFLIRTALVTLGRDAGNEIMLDDPKASRTHARIIFDGKTYQVLDLNSTNGTYLGETRLLPGVPVNWQAEVPLRIGATWLRLVRAEKDETRPSSIGKGTFADLSAFRTSAGAGKVGISMEPSQLVVEPGSSVTSTITLLNQGTVVDHFRLTLGGIPPNWVTHLPPTLQLMPGEQKQIALTIQPPRESNSRAGLYSIRLLAASQEDLSQVAEYKTTLMVSEFSQAHCQLYPERLLANANGRVTVNNAGNMMETFLVVWKDRADEVLFFPPQINLQVPEGQASFIDFRPNLKKRRWFGREQIHPFTALITSQKGFSQTLNGEVVSKARIPPWVLPLVLVLVALIVLLFTMLPSLKGVQPTPPATQPSNTKTPIPTATLKPSPTPEIGGGSGRIAFVSDRQGNQDIYTAMVWSTDVQQLTTSLANEFDPTFSPDGRKIAYITDSFGNGGEVMVMDADGNNPLRITYNNPGTYGCMQPTWSPDSSRLAFTCFSSTGIWNIFLSNADGSGLMNYTSSAVDEFSPAWSPDGKFLAYVQSLDTFETIWLLGINDSGNGLLVSVPVKEGSNGSMPAWSPDGTQIAFCAYQNDSLDVFILNRNSGYVQALTSMSGNERYPSWSPDGKILLFSNDYNGNVEIYRINADGSDLVRVTNSTSLDDQPGWQP
jgi:Tol biopolymer transport system component